MTEEWIAALLLIFLSLLVVIADGALPRRPSFGLDIEPLILPFPPGGEEVERLEDSLSSSRLRGLPTMLLPSIWVTLPLTPLAPAPPLIFCVTVPDLLSRSCIELSSSESITLPPTVVSEFIFLQLLQLSISFTGSTCTIS